MWNLSQTAPTHTHLQGWPGPCMKIHLKVPQPEVP